MTKDQTLPQLLYDSGQLTDEELKESPYRNVLTSAIGTHSQPDAVVYKTRLLDGDRIMLCSDGINAHLDDSEIEAILAADKTADEICQAFIDTTNERGGRDNITAIVATSERIPLDNRN